jgi:hypothetical protein
MIGRSSAEKASERPNRRLQPDAATRPRDQADFGTQQRLKLSTRLPWRRG